MGSSDQQSRTGRKTAATAACRSLPPCQTPPPRWSGRCSHRHGVDDATGTPRVTFGGAVPGEHPPAPSPFLPPLLESGIRRERGSSDPQPRGPRALDVVGRSGLGAEVGWRSSGQGAGLPPQTGGRVEVESRVGPALPMINVVLCGQLSRRTGKAGRAQETPFAQKSLEKDQRETEACQALGLVWLAPLSSSGPVI